MLITLTGSAGCFWFGGGDRLRPDWYPLSERLTAPHPGSSEELVCSSPLAKASWGAWWQSAIDPWELVVLPECKSVLSGFFRQSLTTHLTKGFAKLTQFFGLRPFLWLWVEFDVLVAREDSDRVIFRRSSDTSYKNHSPLLFIHCPNPYMYSKGKSGAAACRQPPAWTSRAVFIDFGILGDSIQMSYNRWKLKLRLQPVVGTVHWNGEIHYIHQHIA